MTRQKKEVGTKSSVWGKLKRKGQRKKNNLVNEGSGGELQQKRLIKRRFLYKHKDIRER